MVSRAAQDPAHAPELDAARVLLRAVGEPSTLGRPLAVSAVSSLVPVQVLPLLRSFVATLRRRDLSRRRWPATRVDRSLPRRDFHPLVRRAFAGRARNRKFKSYSPQRSPK